MMAGRGLAITLAGAATMVRLNGTTYSDAVRGDSMLPFVVKPKVDRLRSKAQTVATVIVDRSALFRAGLVHTLADTRFKVSGQFARLDELDAHVFGAAQDRLLLVSSDEFTEDKKEHLLKIWELYEKPYIVLLGEAFDKIDLNFIMGFSCDAYMLKHEITAKFLLQSLELVVAGGDVFSHEFMEKLRSYWIFRTKGEATASQSQSEDQEAIGALSTREQMWSEGKLSNRENTILMQLMQGSSNKLIARELAIAEATVKVHVKSVLRKIRVKNRTQAAMWAWSHSLRSNDPGDLAALPAP
jgi:two-component system nitrate/nitrite response regulator NarL